MDAESAMKRHIALKSRKEAFKEIAAMAHTMWQGNDAETAFKMLREWLVEECIAQHEGLKNFEAGFRAQ